MEAVFGQIFPATFVALLVALHLAHGGERNAVSRIKENRRGPAQVGTGDYHYYPSVFARSVVNRMCRNFGCGADYPNACLALFGWRA